jgi:hypothetical protein
MITYRTKSTHPETLPTATIYMGGLLCLCFDQTDKCTVAVNNMAGNGHKWKFSIVKQGSQKPIVELTQEIAPKLSEVHIDVTGGAIHGAYVYNGKRIVSIPTIKEQRFNLERSWIDLEGRKGHSQRVVNDNNTLWPRFYINDALFSTSKLSTASFALMDSNPNPLIKPLGNIALDIVADIFLQKENPDSKIEVKLPDKTVSLEKGNRYHIYITNDCDSDFASEHASYVPVLSDFHLHYKAFTRAFDGSPTKMKACDKFHLVCEAESSVKVKTESAVPQTGGDDLGPQPYSDKAPCMQAVLGQTSVFNA